MDFSIIVSNIDFYIEGVKNTVILTLLSLLFGLVLAIPLAVLRSSSMVLLQLPVRGFVYFFRGTPLLVQMYLLYYGLGQFAVVRESLFWPFFKEAP